MRNRTQEQYLKISVFVITLVMIVLRFLLNEKGRVTPDSIRFMRQANVFPEIDNTTAPLLYPLFIKVFTVFTDEFWSSKIVGILSYLFMVFFAWKKKFYWRESLLVGALFSMISLFAATLSETLFLPFLFVFFYVARNVYWRNILKFWAFSYWVYPLFCCLTFVIADYFSWVDYLLLECWITRKVLRKSTSFRVLLDLFMLQVINFSSLMFLTKTTSTNF